MTFQTYLYRFCCGKNYMRHGAMAADIIAVIFGVIAVMLFTPPESAGTIFKSLAYFFVFMAPAVVAWTVFIVTFLLTRQKMRQNPLRQHMY